MGIGLGVGGLLVLVGTMEGVFDVVRTGVKEGVEGTDNTTVVSSDGCRVVHPARIRSDIRAKRTLDESLVLT